MHPSEPGPEERKLLETVGVEVYADAVGRGWIDAGDPAYAEGTPERAARDLLLQLGLLTHDEEAERYQPVDPSAIQAQVVLPLSQRGTELLGEAHGWANAFSALSQSFRTSPQARAHPVTELHGIGNINRFIAAAVSDCRTELLTAQPYGKRRASTLAEAEDRDFHALERGVSMRTLYQHSARQSPATRDYVAEIVSRGAEVRTLDEFFRRLLVFDREVAIIPATENRIVAVVIHDRSLIDYLVDIFNRAWERGIPFTLSGGAVERNIASDVRAMTIRMLAEGHGDAASAKRLGISPRTYAGYIASLKEEYGVQSRFQLGWAMGQAEGSVALTDPDGSADAANAGQAPF